MSITNTIFDSILAEEVESLLNDQVAKNYISNKNSNEPKALQFVALDLFKEFSKYGYSMSVLLQKLEAYGKTITENNSSQNGNDNNNNTSNFDANQTYFDSNINAFNILNENQKDNDSDGSTVNNNNLRPKWLQKDIDALHRALERVSDCGLTFTNMKELTKTVKIVAGNELNSRSPIAIGHRIKKEESEDLNPLAIKVMEMLESTAGKVKAKNDKITPVKKNIVNHKYENETLMKKVTPNQERNNKKRKVGSSIHENDTHGLLIAEDFYVDNKKRAFVGMILLLLLSLEWIYYLYVN